MTIERIADINDPRLDPYRHLRTTNLTRFSGRFIAESKPLVARLVASPLEAESILVDEKFLDEAKTWLPESGRILVVGSDAISQLIGFHFHRGYLACGFRPTAKLWKGRELNSDWTGVFLIGVQDPENMGSILRTCAALGIQDILLGPECVDPFARRVLRVSMGNAFKLHFYQCDRPLETLADFHHNQARSFAACLSPASVELGSAHRTGPTLVLLGNEAHGLPSEIIEASSDGVRIDMSLGTDSLNVSVAAGIILYHLSRGIRRSDHT
ncbi:MAG: RNA methyltransferase [Planctomycetes bacterium]|nr:RNA methyltransferase [Planctomycetota bacterium]